MYFISTIFQGAKMLLATGGAIVSSVVIAYGSMLGGGVIYIVAGSFFLI